MRKLIFLFAAVLLCFPALAHEGHGHTDGYTIIHYVTEPEHVIPLIIVLGGLGLIVLRYIRSVVRK